ncbi:MAG: ArgR family transcriptional regulator [Prevotellaceae bacterium]|nr:ArgR family transcriptional regulator [Prevotellaceae bacterium]
MKNRRIRLQLISEILRLHIVGSQEDLLKLLEKRNCVVAQATLSRDLKMLQVVKTPLTNGNYKYALPPQRQKKLSQEDDTSRKISHAAIVSLEFSGNLGVVKTKPGYAGAVAWDIDNKLEMCVLGTIAGDDTVLIVVREGASKDEIYESMSLIPADRE